MYFAVYVFLAFFVKISFQCFHFPPAFDYKHLGLLGREKYKYNYWNLPNMKNIEESEEEAVMIIGGKKKVFKNDTYIYFEI